MFLNPLRMCALLCLVLAFQLATAHSFQVIDRADTATQATSSASPTTTKFPAQTGKNDDENTDNSSKTASSTASAPVTSTAATSHSSTESVPTSTSLNNNPFLNATIPPGQLPILPEITPGWGVAGIIMMLTGIVYALIGIKNPWVHAFFSTAYMAALGITVLVIYVMNVPLSNALQGGYVAAIILSGCAVGTASMFFKELTEGLGCALGGFCISMWLLCLVPGGLLDSTAAKAVFIACFTLVAFAFYFSRFTRDWSLIVFLAFAGATITVLGIDCFSRAGLKEFWAWIWALNDNLFPLGANTYPVTRGIRVETAAIIIIFLIATMSQVRLWKIVREKREKRDALRAEGQRNLQEEEENVGRQIEEANARDRAQWERVYGDGAAESVTASQISDSGHVFEKNRSHSQIYGAKRRSGDAPELYDVSEWGQPGIDQLMTGEGEEGGVTVRVGADELSAGEGEVEDDEKIAESSSGRQNFDTTGGRASKLPARSKRVSGTAASEMVPVRSSIVTPSPEVVPLPFIVPRGDLLRSQRSSVATFADAQDDTALVAPRRVERHSVVKRLSRGSVELLRTLSRRSSRSAQTPDLALSGGASTEILLTQIESYRQDEDNESLAATMDVESMSGGDRRSMDLVNDEVNDNADPAAEVTAVDKMGENVKPKKSEPAPTDGAVVDQSDRNKQSTRQTATTQPVQCTFKSQGVAGPTESESPDLPVDAPQSEVPKSIAPETSGPASLTKERLPRSLSRVALSYRTNEWAKHLSNAELPDMDELPVGKAIRARKAAKEWAQPVNMEELQRTAEDGAPAPALPRSLSRISTISTASAKPYGTASMDAEALRATSSAAALVTSDASRPVSPKDSAAPPRVQPVSTNTRKISPTVQPIIEEGRGLPVTPGQLPLVVDEQAGTTRGPSLDMEVDHFIKPSAAIPGIVSYGSPQTLLGQRDIFLRTRSQGSLVPNVGEMQSTLTPPMTALSDACSLNNDPMYAAAFASDADEIPLSQRRSMILGSRMSTNESSYSLNRSGSRAGSNHGGADNLAFNSHQPKRNSSVPTQAARDTQLANFRMSVSQDLRAGNPMMNSGGRETPFASTNSLLVGREAEVQRNIEMQRHVLMGQKEAEAQRREMQRRDKEFSDRAFDDRMRSGDLLDAHREAMRKMQRSVSKRT
ncbi:hypothetical protein ISF_09927 [Cordyceps fumosorosea ARSEF 2679]|uniref:TM7S3/TM198-like domain-containing protein n=1 Tax=Cordyceps fumosorosea (strain ARSEF 2679) TaxID=1081104 RepID=A0A166YU63_CORFA|nr:hypothetical protein ISF_09927 [Cordyceps fumosorosea ARSEF 2679]OAA37258.1 hypothetical protein ISF_09927 [Cordyceps fumosorosea ARSEF 2679]